MQTLQGLIARYNHLEQEILGICRWSDNFNSIEAKGYTVGDVSKKDYQTGFVLPKPLMNKIAKEYLETLRIEQKSITEKLNKLEELAKDLTTT